MIHSIGINATTEILFHPNNKNYIYSRGADVVIDNCFIENKRDIFKKHNDFVTSIAISNHGKFIASGECGLQANLYMWDIDTKNIRFCFEEHDSSVQNLIFSCDDKVLVSCGNEKDSKIFFIDTSNGYIITSSKLPKGTTCLVSGGYIKDSNRDNTDNYQFATGGSNGILIWNLDPYQGNVESIPILGDPRATITRHITSLSFTTDNEFLFAGTTSGDFLIINMKIYKIIRVVNGTKREINTILTYDNGILIGCGDYSIKYFNHPLQCVHETKVDGTVMKMTISNNQETLLVITSNGTIMRINMYTNEEMILSENHMNSIITVCCHPLQMDRYATASIDSVIRVWDLLNHQVLTQCNIPRLDPSIDSKPTCLTYTTNDTLLSGWSDGRLLCHNAQSGEILWCIPEAHINGGVTSLTISPDSRTLLTGGYAGEIRRWDLRTRQMIGHYKDHTNIVTGIYMLHDQKAMISASRDRSILRNDLINERRQFTHTQRIGGINCISVSMDESIIFSVGQERRLTCWNINETQPIYTVPLQGEDDEGKCIQRSNDGTLLAVGGTCGVLRLYDAATYECIKNLYGHTSTITAITFSCNDEYMISVGEDHTICIWSTSCVDISV